MDILLLDHPSTLVLVYIVYLLSTTSTCGVNLTVLNWSYTDGPGSLVVAAFDLVHT